MHPCDAGFTCMYAKYSLSCSPCSGKTFSPYGITCVACPHGTGPTSDQTGCIPCEGNNHSSFGVCLPCAPTLVVGADHTQCHDCGARQTAIVPYEAEGDATTRICGCEHGYYNGTKLVHVCFHGGCDQDQYFQTIEKHHTSVESTGQNCELCPADISGEGCIVCADGPPTVSAGFNTSAGARGGMPHVSERNDRHAGARAGGRAGCWAGGRAADTTGHACAPPYGCIRRRACSAAPPPRALKSLEIHSKCCRRRKMELHGRPRKAGCGRGCGTTVLDLDLRSKRIQSSAPPRVWPSLAELDGTDCAADRSDDGDAHAPGRAAAGLGSRRNHDHRGRRGKELAHGAPRQPLPAACLKHPVLPGHCPPAPATSSSTRQHPSAPSQELRWPPPACR